MTVVSISKGARLVGVSRGTLLQVIESGKLQTVAMEEGRPGVDTAELERVYGFLLDDSVADTTILNSIPGVQPLEEESHAVRSQIEHMRSRVASVRKHQERASRTRGSGRLVTSFAGLLALLVVGAVVYRFWGGSVESSSTLATDTPAVSAPTGPVAPQPTVPIIPTEPLTTMPSAEQASGYIDDLVLEPPSSAEPEVRELANPQVVPATDTVVDAATPAPEPPPVAEAPEETPSPEASPESELARFMQSLEPGDFVVVVGSFASEAGAQETRDRLRRQHPELFRPNLSPTSGNTADYENYYQRGRFWVVYVGDFYSRESAERLRQKAVEELGMRDDSFLQRPLQ